jgi:D-aminopeptidase
MIRSAIESAQEGRVAEGAVGAGAGTVAFGWKGGIGTSSRLLPRELDGYVVGVLVQSNFGGVLQMAGLRVGEALGQHYLAESVRRGGVDGEDKADGAEGANKGNDRCGADGSIMIVVATDAPLSDRNLTRLARRALAGLARTGASMTDGSGDYVIAFSTAREVRRMPATPNKVPLLTDLPNARMSPLFQAVIEATEEAIYNSLCMAITMSSNGTTVEALPLDKVAALISAWER